MLSMSTLSTACKVMVLPTAAVGAQLVAIGAGLLPADGDQLQMVKFWSGLAGVTISTKAFFGFIGVGKIIGTAALWGYLPKFWRLGSLCPMLCAVYMHAQDVPVGTSGAVIAPLVMAAMVIFTFYADPADEVKGKKKKA